MSEIVGVCLSCGSKQRQQLIREKGDFGIFKCRKCGTLHHLPLTTREVMFITSTGGKATKIYGDVSESLRKGGSIVVNKTKYEIRSIENQDGARVEECEPEDVRTIWIQPYEKKLNISVHVDGFTKAYSATLDKDQELKVGEIIESGGVRIRITKMATTSGESKSGRVASILSLIGELEV